MGINVDGAVIFGFSFEQDDISIGAGDTSEVFINGGTSGQIDRVELEKRQLTLTLRGAIDSDIVALENIRVNNVNGLLNRNLVTEDINIGGYIIEEAYITKVTPSGPRIVNGKTIFNSTEIIVSSRNYS